MKLNKNTLKVKDDILLLTSLKTMVCSILGDEDMYQRLQSLFIYTELNPVLHITQSKTMIHEVP